MSELGRRLNGMRVGATSPDGSVRVLIKGRGDPTVSFADPDDFHQYEDVSTLADQVSAALNWAARGLQEAHDRIVGEYSRLSRSDEPHWNSEVRRMYERLESTAIDGYSAWDFVRVTTTGLTSWWVWVHPAAWEDLAAGQFCGEVNAAIRDAKQQYFHTMRSMKAEVLGLSPM